MVTPSFPQLVNDSGIMPVSLLRLYNSPKINADFQSGMLSKYTILDVQPSRICILHNDCCIQFTHALKLLVAEMGSDSAKKYQIGPCYFLRDRDFILNNEIFSRARFQLAVTGRSQWPKDSHAEVAFAGRSNVGKSSAINAITGQKNLSRTSKTPGRTQQIVFFKLLEGRYLVDLPGYGYAKAPDSLRQEWEKFITDYLFNRMSLKVLCIPMDIRRPLTSLDLSMLDLCQDIGLHAHILLTKADKFKKGKATSLYHEVIGKLAEQPMISVQLFSAKNGLGVQEAKLILRDFLTEKSRQHSG